MFTKEVLQALQAHVSADESLIEIPPDSSLGDYAFPCFTLAKELKKAPPQIATELAEKIEVTGVIERVTATGPYVNFFIKKEALIEAAFTEVTFPSNGKKVIIEFSAPNIAKRFGIGHLRSTIIGAALQRIYSFAGWETITVNHLGDWGTQFGKLIAAYKKWPVNLAEDPISKLSELYVRWHEEEKNDSSLTDIGRAEFKKLEEGDAENTKLWKQFVDLSLVEFTSLYERMNVSFDHYTGESFYTDKMQGVVNELRDKKLLEESDGAQIVSLEDAGIKTPALILKSDGSTLYMTRDLAAAMYRRTTFDFDRMLYEVGNEQRLHFLQLFAVLKKMGYDWADTCEHVGHGLYLTDGQKMSTRKGKSVFVQEVFSEAVERSQATIKEKNPELADAEVVAEAVGVGAIMFNDVKNDRNNDINFSWEEILNFEGESGPYVQYTYARLCSIQRKSSVEPQADATLLLSDEEVALAKQLIGFESVIESCVSANKPHILARHVLDISQLANTYYQKHKIIQENQELEAARLALIAAVAENIRLSLSLLGLNAPEEM